MTVTMETKDLALHQFGYEIDGTPDGRQHSYYWHIVPGAPSETREFKAFDEEGGFETSCAPFDAAGHLKSEFKIKYRSPMRPARGFT